MKTKRIGMIVALLLLSMPFAARAADQGAAVGKVNLQNMEGVTVLGTDTQYGVKAMGHLMSSPKSMAQNGMDMNHHFMVKFNDAKNGAPIADGLVALKVTTPSGATGAPIRLMPMTVGMVKGFGAGIRLTAKGTYRFEVGCKLPDGHKRQFHFTYTLQ